MLIETHRDDKCEKGQANLVLELRKPTGKFGRVDRPQELPDWTRSLKSGIYYARPKADIICNAASNSLKCLLGLLIKSFGVVLDLNQQIFFTDLYIENI